MAKLSPAPTQPKPQVVSTTTTLIVGDLRLQANTPTPVEPDQVEYLLSLRGVVLVDAPASAEAHAEPIPTNPVADDSAAMPKES